MMREPRQLSRVTQRPRQGESPRFARVGRVTSPVSRGVVTGSMMRRQGFLYRSMVVSAAAFTLVALRPAAADATLARTPVPYMGWNTYYQVGSETSGITESTIKSVAQSLVSTGLAKAGYNIVWLDYGWASGARDASGNLSVDLTQWPSGLSALTSYLHSLGLQAGIYTDAGHSGCSGQGVGSYGHYQQDVDQFAAWGFDAVKVDFCGAGQQWRDVPPNDPRTLYAKFSDAVANAGANTGGRPMILNVCNFWVPGQINGSAPAVPSFEDSSWDAYSWAPAMAQSWRTDTDIGYPRKPDGSGGIEFVNVLRNLSHDTGTASDVAQPGVQATAGPPGTPASTPVAWGHWNDPDNLGPGLGMTDTEAQSQLSMWAMVAAPLILGADPRLLSPTNVNMLTNPRVIAVDQDSLGAQGYRLSQSGSAQVWVKPLAGGARAVALLNTGSTSQPISTNVSAIGMPKARSYTLLNLWTNQTSPTKNTITATVLPHAVVLYKVSAG